MDSILVISIISFIYFNLFFFCLSVAIEQHWIFDCSCLFPQFLYLEYLYNLSLSLILNYIITDLICK